MADGTPKRELRLLGDHLSKELNDSADLAVAVASVYEGMRHMKHRTETQEMRPAGTWTEDELENMCNEMFQIFEDKAYVADVIMIVRIINLYLHEQ
jgi:hypothetical protein